MKDVVRFFWERTKRAWQMDEANRLQGNPVKYWIEADEWTNAFKATLSKNKQDQFDKEWDKLEKELQDWHNASPKKLASMKNPLLF